jgi:hypothetical protein
MCSFRWIPSSLCHVILCMFIISSFVHWRSFSIPFYFTLTLLISGLFKWKQICVGFFCVCLLCMQINTIELFDCLNVQGVSNVLLIGDIPKQHGIWGCTCNAKCTLLLKEILNSDGQQFHQYKQKR